MKRAFLALAAWLTLASGALAQSVPAPPLLNFQGRLAKPDGTPVPDGTYSVRFSLHDAASGGNEKWNQTINNISVLNGTFAVLLNVAAPATLFDNNLWMEIKIGNDAALSPRQQLVSVAYALKANTVPDGSIGTSKLTDSAVTTDKIASNAVTAAKIASDAAAFNRVSGGAFSSINGHLDLDTNRTITLNPNDAFTFDGKSLPHYSLGWFTDSWNLPGATAWLSGYAGVRLFTNGQSRVNIAQSGNVGIGVTDPGLNRLQINPTFHFSNGYGLTVSNARFGANVQYNGANGLGLVVDKTDGVNGSFPLLVRRSVGTGPVNLLSVSDTGVTAVQVLQITGGSDVAEPYHISGITNRKSGIQSGIRTGFVVSIDEKRVGQMRLAAKPYDPAVAGIISGAGGVKPGLTLTQAGSIADGKHPVAMTGRVWCWCDADANGPIAPGNLLTSSRTPGHAMRATDARRSQGAVLGKAMSPLQKGKGLVLVLVRPQ